MKKIINFYGITDDPNIGYGMATRNMRDAFLMTNSNVNYIGLNSNFLGSSNLDFFLRPPGWPTTKSKRKVGYFYWEAMPLPLGWQRAIFSADEIWAPCQLVKDCCLMAGFSKPIHIVPTPFRPWDINISGSLSINGIDDSTYKFYSIFQWHTRKGWKELLTAYFNEFSNEDNVVLILKVNSIHGTIGNNSIRSDIEHLKIEIGKKNLPKVFVIDSYIPMEHIWALHEYADCYVSPHHGEGWGMPIHDAIYAKNQLIITKFGGVTEMLNDSCANIIEHRLGPVQDMGWNPVYSPDQTWAYPSVEHLSFLMRDVFLNHNDDKYIQKQNNLNKIIEKTSIKSVSNLISNII